MKNSKTLYQEVVTGITLSESVDEITSIALLIMENVFGVSRTDIVAGKPIMAGAKDLVRLKKYIDRLNRGEPVQYILKETYFFGRVFHVRPSVLIPRPETELLVRTVLTWKESFTPARHRRMSVLDIGTGSGCIPVTLRLELPETEIYATDISAAALAVAKENAASHDADITFLNHDILNEDIPLDEIDVVVSNPPYVTRSEANDMKQNVLRFEPHGALFVPDDDPLLFYKEIVKKSKVVLRDSGLLAVEINEKFAGEVAYLFTREGFMKVDVLNDLDGKPRVIRGVSVK